MVNSREVFAALNEDYKRPTRWELNDFLGLSKLVELGWAERGEINGKPSLRDLISCAEHDEIWLAVDMDWLDKWADKKDIEYLYDCGICYTEEHDCLHMFV